MVPARSKRPMYPNSVEPYLSVILVEAYLSVILSEVRRQPNGVERPRCCFDLLRS
jgi:hypothetical protein